MRDTVMVLSRRPPTLLVVALVVAASLTGCAVPAAQRAEGSPVTPSSPLTSANPEATSAPAGAPTPGESVAASTSVPESTAGATEAPVSPGSPASDATPEPTLPALSAAQQERFGGCLAEAVRHWSSGACATLAQQALAEQGYLEGNPSKRIDVRGANAILNYQRSRGIHATGTLDEATWVALATNQEPRSSELPEACRVAGTVLCVDQGARTLRYVVDGTVERTVPVRLGGFAQHAKNKNWRNFPTANGTYRVYDKQRNPRSENYGAGAMPYSIMFHPDMYVHYSSGFAKQGYAGSSHGCVNVGDKAAITWLFEHTPIGATVHVY